MEVDPAVEEDKKTVLADPNYLQQVLEGLPGSSAPVKEETLQAAKNLAQKSATSTKSLKKSPEKDQKKPDSKQSPKKK